MIAVITGDLVDSSRLDAIGYKTAIKVLEDHFGDLLAGESAAGEIFRGDSFQLRLDDPAPSMRHALLIRLSLLSQANCKATLSIGLGDSLVTGDRPGTSQGEAYVLSGRGLESSLSGTTSLHTHCRELQQTLLLPTRMLDFILASLTRKQAEMLYHFIKQDFPEHQMLAELTGTSRQNVSKHLSRAGAELVKDYLVFFAQQVSQTVNQENKR